jgi:hypothetical protein
MKKLILIPVLLLLASCTSRDESHKDFVDQVLDVTIRTSSDKSVEFPELYDSLAHEIPEDQDEKLILVERLKHRGFDVVSSGRGNFPPLGPRIVAFKLRKGNCTCEVSKKYYATATDTIYQMVEGISCKKSGL